MQYLSEGKKYKDSDIPTIAKFCVELIRRYPTVPGLLEESFTESLKFVGSNNDKMSETVNKSVFFSFVNCVFVVQIVKENHVGKVIKTLADYAKSDIVSIF